MKRILGIDTGTNSLGWAVIDRDDNGLCTLIKKGSLIFQEGVKISRDLDKKLTSAEETVAKLIDNDGTEHKLDPNNASAPEE